MHSREGLDTLWQVILPQCWAGLLVRSLESLDLLEKLEGNSNNFLFFFFFL